MILEFYDPDGELITEVEIPDSAFHHMETEAALQGISVQKYILNFLHDYATEVIENGKDKA